jgi:hypothetical protein
MDNDNESGLDLEEYWHYMHKFNSDFNKIFGVKNERTQQTESSTNDIASNEAEQVRAE